MKNFYPVLSTVFLAICLFFITNNSYAVTAKPGYTQFTQPDGSTLTISGRGDEFIHWAVSIDGYTLIHNEQGAFEYATLANDGKMITSGILAHEPGNRSFTEINFLNTISTGLFYTAAQVAEIKEKCPIKREYGAKIGGFPTTGTNKMLLILANFSNTSTTYTQTNFDNYMNQANYNGIGSFKDFYLQNSYNLLTVNTTVTIWVAVPNTHNYYGPEAKWGEFVRDAVNAADAAGVDFSQFDNDGNGQVDGIAVIHQGQGQEETSNTNDIWSHSSSLSYSYPGFSKDGKLITNYTCQPEKSYSGMSTVGVMCHEFGHNLGAPDFYDTNYGTGGSYVGTGRWDLMADGSWNQNGAKPACHNAWTKAFYTWITPTLITTTGTKTLRNAETYQDAFMFITPSTNEYYLMENRQKIGFDNTTSFPGHGMIIYHVDGNYITSHMSAVNAGSHQGMYPVCASSAYSPSNYPTPTATQYGSINSAGCPYPGTTSKTQFTDATTPWAKSWANALSNTPINTIAEASQIITFNVQAVGGVAPVVDFMTGGSTTINAGGSVDFYDNSSNNPTAWSWTFNGGTPGTSTIQYPPSITYSTGGSYDVTLFASNPYGNNTLTKPGYITVLPVGISNFSREKYINIFPNPSNGVFNLHIFTPEKENINITISNVLGLNVYKTSIVKQPEDYTATIDLSNLSNGLYFISFNNSKEIVTKSLLIQK